MCSEQDRRQDLCSHGAWGGGGRTRDISSVNRIILAKSLVQSQREWKRQADGAGLSKEVMFDLRPGGKKSVLHSNGGRTFLQREQQVQRPGGGRVSLCLRNRSWPQNVKCGEPVGEWFEVGRRE